jgi:hypothetical protein
VSCRRRGPLDRPFGRPAAAIFCAAAWKRRVDFSALAAHKHVAVRAWSPHRRAGVQARCSVDGRYDTGAASTAPSEWWSSATPLGSREAWSRSSCHVPCAGARGRRRGAHTHARRRPGDKWHAAVRHLVGYVRCGAILLLRPAPARSARAA